MFSLTREVVKSRISLTITCVREPCPAPKTKHAFWQWATMFGMLSVNDFEEMQNCLRVEIFMTVKLNTLTYGTEVEWNNLSIIPCKGLRV
jgi:hypothetical protein